jgi:hypothetical protein
MFQKPAVAKALKPTTLRLEVDYIEVEHPEIPAVDEVLDGEEVIVEAQPAVPAWTELIRKGKLLTEVPYDDGTLKGLEKDPMTEVLTDPERLAIKNALDRVFGLLDSLAD